MQNVKFKCGIISHLDAVFAIRAIKTRMQAAKRGSSPHMSLVSVPSFRVKEICKQLNMDAADFYFNYGFSEYSNNDLDVNFVNGFFLHVTLKRGDTTLAVVGHYADFVKPYIITTNRDDLDLPIEM